MKKITLCLTTMILAVLLLPLASYSQTSVDDVLQKLRSVENPNIAEPSGFLTEKESALLKAYYGTTNSSNRLAIGDVQALDIRNGGVYGTFPLSGPFNIAQVGTNPATIYASDFGGDGVLYGLVNDTKTLVTINMTNGQSTTVGPLTGLIGTDTASGLSWNPVDQTMYALSTGVGGTTLYSIDLATGAATNIGASTVASGIWIAIDNDGVCYMASLATDSLYTIDLATGTSTLVGPLGINISFAQEADVDTATNTLYMAAYIGGGVNGIYSVDVATGTATSLGTVNANNAELGIFGIEGPAVAVDNFTCDDVSPIGLGITSTVGITNTAGGASNTCLSGATNSIWYRFTAANSGELTISSDLPGSAGVDTRVSVYNDDCAALSCIASDDDSGTDDSSEVTLSVVSGTTYYIEWDDADDASAFDFELSLDISCPDPENFTVDTVANSSADFSWDDVADATNGYILSVFILGANPDTATPVYTEDVPAGTLTATATGLTGNMTYDAYLTADCDANGFSNRLKRTFTTTPPNDAVCDAIALTLDAECSGAPYSSLDATTEAGEQAASCFVGGAQSTVWFTFVAPANGRVVITTDIAPATHTDTEIAVYAAPTDCTDASTLGTALGCDQDSGVDITFNSILELDETVLTPGDTYYIQVSGYNDAAGTFCIEVATGASCAEIENFDVSNATTTAADFSWDAEPNATSGYVFSVFTEGDDPDTDTAVYTEAIAAGTTTATATGLTPDTAYDAYIVADCDTLGTSDMVMLSFSTSPLPPECGGQFTDTGGASAGYSANEEITTTITPDNSGDAVTITFTYVDIEAATTVVGVQDGCYDFLTIYNGPDATSPVLAETLCGEESGDGGVPFVATSLLSVGDSFSSTDASGALTIVFTSDGSVQLTGWVADVTCAVLSIDDAVASGFNYYPNPTTNILYAKAQQPIESVTLFNMLGQEVMTLRPDALNISLDLSGLSIGTYFMKSTINGNTFTHKVIKK